MPWLDLESEVHELFNPDKSHELQISLYARQIRIKRNRDQTYKNIKADKMRWQQLKNRINTWRRNNLKHKEAERLRNRKRRKEKSCQEYLMSSSKLKDSTIILKNPE